MPRPRRDPDNLVTPSQARAARRQALRDAGGWSGHVELDATDWEALQALQGDQSISETIGAAVRFMRRAQAQRQR